MSLSAQEIFDQAVAHLENLTLLPNIGDVVFKIDPFLKGSEKTKRYLESLGINWWIYNDSKLWLVIDLQEIASQPKDLQPAALRHLAWEYKLTYTS